MAARGSRWAWASDHESESVMSPIDWVSLREIVLLFVKCSSAAFSYLIAPMMSHANS